MQKSFDEFIWIKSNTVGFPYPGKSFEPFKVVYIGDENGDGGIQTAPDVTTNYSLTLGKFYLVTNYWIQSNDQSQEGFYTLTNDMGVSLSYSKSLFKTLDEFRNEKIKEILN
jgi:hypothetical protein